MSTRPAFSRGKELSSTLDGNSTDICVFPITVSVQPALAEQKIQLVLDIIALPSQKLQASSSEQLLVNFVHVFLSGRSVALLAFFFGHQLVSDCLCDLLFSARQQALSFPELSVLAEILCREFLVLALCLRCRPFLIRQQFTNYLI